MLTGKERKEMHKRLSGLQKKESSLAKSRPEKKSNDPSNIMRYTHLGAEFIIIFLAFLFLGSWLDTTLATSPWILLLCTVLGFSMAMYRLIKVANELSK